MYETPNVGTHQLIQCANCGAKQIRKSSRLQEMTDWDSKPATYGSWHKGYLLVMALVMLST